MAIDRPPSKDSGKDRGWWGAGWGAIGGIAGTTCVGLIAGLGLTGLGWGLIGFGVLPGCASGFLVNILVGPFAEVRIARGAAFLAGALAGGVIVLPFIRFVYSA